MQSISGDEMATLLAGLVGERLPGGCDDCDAWHEYTSELEGVFDIWIHHADSCPVLRAAGG